MRSVYAERRAGGGRLNTGQVFRHVRGAETLRRAAEAARWDVPKPGPGFGRGIAGGATAARPGRLHCQGRGGRTGPRLSSSVPDTGVGFYS